MEETDTYKTIEKSSNETLFKEKGSKFFGYTFPVSNETEVNNALEQVKILHKSARHFCYAYQLGSESIYYRVNDDGEPSNSAGMPIYGQIQSFDVTNILIVVVRYFGGTKLGVGGLISAYKTSAKLALEASKIVEKTIDIRYEVVFDYQNINKVMRIIKEKNLDVVNQQLEVDCKIWLSIRKSKAKEVEKLFESIYEVNIHQIN
ncbi:YigZ family protein [uncultured Planktosalinus sp.]|uniref:IMPACT family protein n=1 Tax=uncultured Planktosalinus sp. TaxID=1810935 RepID=UPI0030D7F701